MGSDQEGQVFAASRFGVWVCRAWRLGPSLRQATRVGPLVDAEVKIGI